MSIQNAIDRASEQQIVFLNLGVPMGVFKLLNELAAKEKKTFATFVAEALKDKAEEIAAKHEPPKQGG